jgi:hypothetical protein
MRLKSGSRVKTGKKNQVEILGADIETFHRLEKKNSSNIEYTSHIEKYTKSLSEEGLRILIWAKRVVTLKEVTLLYIQSLIFSTMNGIKNSRKYPNLKLLKRKLFNLTSFGTNSKENSL